MTEPMSRAADDVSLFAIGTTILRYRMRIVVWALIGAVAAAIPAVVNKQTYSTTASFVPQGAEIGRSGLANLAGQLGVGLPTSGSFSQSPEFYADLLDSRELLTRIVRDTFQVAEVS